MPSSKSRATGVSPSKYTINIAIPGLEAVFRSAAKLCHESCSNHSNHALKAQPRWLAQRLQSCGYNVLRWAFEHLVKNAIELRGEQRLGPAVASQAGRQSVGSAGVD